MLTSLILVLVLLLIGFSSIYVAWTGEAMGSGSGSILSRSRRVVLVVISLLALASACYLYASAEKPKVRSNRASNVWGPPASPEPAENAESRTFDIAAVRTDEAPNEAQSKSEVETRYVQEQSRLSAETSSLATGAEDAEAAGLSEAAMALLNARQTSATLVKDESILVPIDQPSAPVTPKSANRESPLPSVPDEAFPAPVVVSQNAAHSGESGRGLKAEIQPKAVLPRNPLTIYLYNNLGPDQQAEQLELNIEGRSVAHFSLGETMPSIVMGVRLPRPGVVRYTLDGYSTTKGRRSTLRGSGTIALKEGQNFAIERTPDQKRVFLQPISR